MADEDEMAILSAVYFLYCDTSDDEQAQRRPEIKRQRQRRQCRQRRFWMHDIIRRRENFGEFSRLVQELREDKERFHRYFRMTTEQFDYVLNLVSPFISRSTTNFRSPISAAERLAITLRFLATGDSYHTIASSYRLGVSTVCKIVPETCDAIWLTLQPLFMPVPKKEDWINIASEFERKRNFPNCVGAVDGKHVVVKCPPKSGSMFFNYKSTFSVVLLAVVDANYSFLVIDVGGYGKQSDGGTFATSAFGINLNTGKIDLPEASAPAGYPDLLPYVFVADEAFPLTKNMMRPFPGKQLGPTARIYNYRLSRARRVVENAFGILAARFRVFHRTIEQRPDTTDKIIKATCVLHNMLMKAACVLENSEECNEPNNEACEDDLPGALLPLQATKRLRASHEAFEIRNKYADYFSSPCGQVSWQYDI